jgi:hypothetical protein
LIQRASNCVSNPSGGSNGSNSRKIGYSNGSSSTVSTNFSKNLASGFGSKSGFDKQVPSSVGSSTLVRVEKDVSAKGSELFTRDDSYVSKSKSTFYHNGFGFIIKIHNCYRYNI